MDFLTAVTRIGSVIQGARSVVDGLGELARSRGAKTQPVVVIADQQGFNAHLKQAVAGLIESRDANKDGVLSATESGLDQAAFGRLDTNGDGKLDALELMGALDKSSPILVNNAGQS